MQFMQWSNICVDSTNLLHSRTSARQQFQCHLKTIMIADSQGPPSLPFPEAHKCFRDTNQWSFRNESSRGNTSISVSITQIPLMPQENVGAALEV